MKNLNLLVMVFALLLFSCKKDEVQPESLIGTWELRHVLGGQIANVPHDYPEGNGSIIQFSSSEYQIIAEGRVISKGTYHIVQDQAEIDGTSYKQQIIFDEEPEKAYIKLSGSKLLVCWGTIALDGYTNTYEKIVSGS